MRPLAPRKVDFQKWRRLVREVRAIVQTPRGPSGDLSRAASTACRAVAPTRELLTSTCSPLVRGCERLCAMHPGDPERPQLVATLGRLAEALAPHVETAGPTRTRGEYEGRQIEPRKDIFG